MRALLVLSAALVWAACSSSTPADNAPLPLDDRDVPDADETGETTPPVPAAGFEQRAFGPLYVQLKASPPALRVVRADGTLVAETLDGVLDAVQTDYKSVASQGFLGVTETVVSTLTFTAGAARFADGAVELATSAGAAAAVRIAVTAETGAGLALDASLADGAGGLGFVPNQVRWRFKCRPSEGFLGLGAQSDGHNHRGKSVPIRVTEQGLAKSPEVPESSASARGHVYDAYYPLPYVVVVAPDPDASAYGAVLDSAERSRFVMCTDAAPDLFEMRAEISSYDGESKAVAGAARARLRLLPGPDPAAVAGQYTALYGLPQPVPRWGFGPWVAIEYRSPERIAGAGAALAPAQRIVAGAGELVAAGVPATAVWHQDWDDYTDDGLRPMAIDLRALGLRALTYYNSFVIINTPEYNEAIAGGFVPKYPNGDPYTFLFLTNRATFIDFTHPEGRAHFARRFVRSWGLGVDGWMADYAEWVTDDMVFHSGIVGRHYGNRYTIDWQIANREAIKAAGREGDGLFFSRSGYLHANRYHSVVWAGDQRTDFDRIDGLASVIPYGTNLALAGVSAYAHDVAGYTPLVAPPSTKELYFRWSQVGAFSPVMRTHEGRDYTLNHNWNTDPETTAEFVRRASFHLRLNPYLTRLHELSTQGIHGTMVPVAMRFPRRPESLRAEYDFMLGHEFFVAPVVEDGARERTFWLPPGRWYDLETGAALDGNREHTVDAPLDTIPAYLAAGAIVPMFDASVKHLEQPTAGPPRAWGLDTEKRRLDVWVGEGADGAFALTGEHAVGFELRRAAPRSDRTRIRLVPENRNITPCTGDQSAAADACYADTATEGRWVEAARTGPGRIEFPPRRTGDRATVFIVTGGPAERRYLVRLYRG